MTSLVKLSKSSTRYISFTPCLQRLKAEWRMDRKPANTKLSDENAIEERRVFGGRKKCKAVQLSNAKYSLSSQNIKNATLKILDVVHAEAGQHIIDNKIIVKGASLLVDITPVKENISFEKLTQCEKSLEHVAAMYVKGQLYARVTSRPGQVGNCDGVILEGKELEDLINRI